MREGFKKGISFQGLRHESARKMLALQMLGPRFEPQHPDKKRSVVFVPIVSVQGGRDRKISWAHWLKQSSQTGERQIPVRGPVSKHKAHDPEEEGDSGWASGSRSIYAH